MPQELRRLTGSVKYTVKDEHTGESWTVGLKVNTDHAQEVMELFEESPGRKDVKTGFDAFTKPRDSKQLSMSVRKASEDEF